MLVTVVLLAGCGGGSPYHSTRGARIEPFTIHSVWLHRDLHEIFVVPPRHGRRWLLVLLHGRGAGPQEFLSQPFFDELAALGRRAPFVLLLDGGDHSYWHDRKDGPWAREVLLEGILAGVGRARTPRVALGGISMGGYGALLLGIGGTWCAVGAHSPAIWERAADTAPGAFDDAADFARNDIFGHPPNYGRTPVWIDVGASDPFHDAAVAYAHKIHAQLHVWPGGHEESYWRAHIAQYLVFYARHCG